MIGFLVAVILMMQKPQPHGCVPYTSDPAFAICIQDGAIVLVPATGTLREQSIKSEPREYPAILHEVDNTPACRVYLDVDHCRWVKPSTKKAYTCKNPDSEVLEYTVSGKGWCRKVN